MDGLRALALQELEQKVSFSSRGNLRHSTTQLDLIQIGANAAGQPEVQVTRASEAGTLKELESSTAAAEEDHSYDDDDDDDDDDDAAATAQPPPPLALAVLRRGEGGVFSCSKTTFLQLVHLFGIDAYTLQLLSNRASGLHHEPPSTPTDPQTYYIGAFCYTLAWTFDARRRRTRGIVVVPEHFWRKMEADPVAELRAVLAPFAARARSALLPAFVALVHLLRKLDELVELEMHSVRVIEQTALYRSRFFSRSDLGFEFLGSAVSVVDASLYHSHNHLRHLDLLDELADLLLGAHAEAAAARGAKGEGECEKCSAAEEDLAALAPAVRVLRRHAAATRGAAEYFRERAKNLYSVIFALMTHEDARISLEHTAASRELAEAAKADSASMKTVAVMTMAFLPGTFIAALFAVPSLRWDLPAVVQPNFWVYWAFTIPATLIVFAFWMVFTRWPPTVLLETAARSAK